MVTTTIVVAVLASESERLLPYLCANMLNLTGTSIYRGRSRVWAMRITYMLFNR